jgi:uncharacterized membrane protein
MKKRQVLRKLFQYFLQGLIILAPIIITIYAVTGLFNFIDNIVPNILNTIFPHWVGTDEAGNPRKIPGIGFVVVVLSVIMVGYISSSFIVGRVVDLFDRVLERTPGVKIIYTTVKDFFEAFAGNKRKFDKAVLVSVKERDVWQIGFITQQDMKQFGLEEYLAVYIPNSYALAGQLYFVQKDRIKLTPDVGPADALKFAISGGVAELEE